MNPLPDPEAAPMHAQGNHPRADRTDRALTRREFLVESGKVGVAGAAAASIPLSVLAADPAEAAGRRVFNKHQRKTLHAALARMIPAEGPGDWSAADVGAGRYIEHLLAGTHRIYGGGPNRRRFRHFQRLSRVKRIGWRKETRRLRRLYRAGLAELDRQAGGDFASAPEQAQDQILQSMDEQGHPFFAALYIHTMEGVYAHPAYGGNRHFRAWREFGYQGDVHGVRFPGIGPDHAPWNVYGGYAPDEMVKPGKGP